MTDSFAREITYARVSLTDRCNLRCRYCMPQDCMPPPRDSLTDDEILALIRGLADAGIRKIRFTGGEPTVRPGALELFSRVCRTPWIDTWALTTNAQTLARDAVRLREAGITHVNISLDTLDAEDYRALSGGDLAPARAGLSAALSAGFERVKLNAVLIRGISETQIPRLAALTQQHPLDVRFIELMPTGLCSEWAQAHFLPASAVLDALPELLPDIPEPHAPATYYRLPDASGRVGLITPMSCSFCAACNRIRITADGKLRACLHADTETDLRPLLHDPHALQTCIREAVRRKPSRHHLTEGQFITRSMTQIGG